MRRLTVLMALILIGMVMTGCGGKTHGDDGAVTAPPAGDVPPVDTIVTQPPDTTDTDDEIEQPSDDEVVVKCAIVMRGKRSFLCCPMVDKIKCVRN